MNPKRSIFKIKNPLRFKSALAESCAAATLQKTAVFEKP